MTNPSRPRSTSATYRSTVTLLASVAILGGCATAAPRQSAAPAAAAPVATDIAVASFDTAWSRIGAAHYDSLMGGLDWQAVRAELRPRASAARTMGELREVLNDLTGRLGESHYGLIPAESFVALETRPDAASRQHGETGITLRLIGDDVVVTEVAPGSPAARAGVRTGWIVDSVGTFSAARMRRALAALDSDRDRREARIRVPLAATARFNGPLDSTVSVVFRDAGDRVTTVPIGRQAPRGTAVQFASLPAMYVELEHERIPLEGACIGVIRFNVWMPQVAAEFDRAMSAVRDCRGIVLDLRGNVGGVGAMVMGISGYFLNDVQSLGTMRTRREQLRFVSNPRRVNNDGQAISPFAGPLAILVDDQSISTSEIFASGMQGIGRARVFGDTTPGQALPAYTMRLASGDVLMYVVADFVGPDGQRVEGRGTIPDVALPARRAALLDGRDEAREEAIRWAASGRAGAQP